MEVERNEPKNVTEVGTRLALKEESILIETLRDNMDLFTWRSTNTPDIDPKVVSHRLAINHTVKLFMHKIIKFAGEKRVVV